jgi:hypothetical protein
MLLMVGAPGVAQFPVCAHVHENAIQLHVFMRWRLPAGVRPAWAMHTLIVQQDSLCVYSFLHGLVNQPSCSKPLLSDGTRYVRV